MSAEVSHFNTAIQGLAQVHQLHNDVCDAFGWLHSLADADAADDDEQRRLLAKQLKDRLKQLMDSHDRLDKLLQQMGSAASTAAAASQLSPSFAQQMLHSSMVSTRQDNLSNHLDAHSWLNKLQEYSSLSASMMQSFVPYWRRQSRIFKKSPMQVASLFQQVNMQALLSQYKQTADMTLSLEVLGASSSATEPSQSPQSLVVLVTLSRVLRAAVLMQGILMQSVLVKACSESFRDDQASSRLDLSGQSRFVVFQRISSQLRGYLLQCQTHLLQQGSSQMAANFFRQFVQLIYSYRTLFSEPCAHCGKILRDRLPPVCRQVAAQPTAMHELCRMSFR